MLRFDLAWNDPELHPRGSSERRLLCTRPPNRSHGGFHRPGDMITETGCATSGNVLSYEARFQTTKDKK